MPVATLLDWESAAIVFGGTCLATVLRSGRTELRALSQLLLGQLRPAFRFELARGRLASCISAIQRDGIYRAPPAKVTDPDLERLLTALLGQRSLAACLAEHRACRSARRRMRENGLRLLHSAGELAPVSGLAGTLIALGGSAAGAGAQADLVPAVATAVLTTLYGLLLAHLVILPLARRIERRAEREEGERQRLADWLTEQLRQAMPESRLVEVGSRSSSAVQDRAA